MSSPLKPDPATGNVSSRGQGVAIGSTRGAINPECLLETVPILRSPPNPQTNNDAHDKKPINEEEAHKDTSTDAKLEDEEALKPPNIDLPAFTFDDYESVRLSPLVIRCATIYRFKRELRLLYDVEDLTMLFFRSARMRSRL